MTVTNISSNTGRTGTLNYADGDQINFTDLNGNNIGYTATKNGNDVVLSTNVSFYATINITPNGEDFAYISDEGGKYQVETGEHKAILTLSTVGDGAGYYWWRLEDEYGTFDGEKHYGMFGIGGDSFHFDAEGNVTSIEADTFDGLTYQFTGFYEVVNEDTENPIDVTKGFYEVVKDVNSVETMSAAHEILYNAENDGISATLTNYAKNNNNKRNIYINGDSETGANLANYVYNIAVDNETGVYTDTWVNENITGTNGVDQITVSGGTNTIWGGKGNDRIALNSTATNPSYNTIIISGEDEGFVEKITNPTANDTIKLTKDGAGYKFSELNFALKYDMSSRSDTLIITTPDNGQVQISQFAHSILGKTSVLDNLVALNDSDVETAYQISTDVLPNIESVNVKLRNGLVFDRAILSYNDKKIVFSGSGTIAEISGDDTLSFSDNVTCTRVGNDLVVSDGVNTITVKDYVTNQVGNIIVGDNDTATLNSITNTVADFHIIEAATSANKKGVVTGSALAETIIDSDKNNTIKGGGGNDVIYTFAGKNKVYTQSKTGDEVDVYSGYGNDTFNAGLGSDTYYFLNGHGSDTVVLNAKAEATNLVFSSNAELSFKESGKNLVITSAYDITGNDGTPNVKENVTLKNYLTNKYENVYINDGSGNLTELNAYFEQNNITFDLGNAKAKKAQKINGTQLNENITGGKKNDVIKSGAGDDTITGGAGNDKLYGNALGDKTFVFNAKDGADTLYNAKAEDTIKINLDSTDANMKYTRKGNNLVIQYNSYKSGKKTKNDTITVSNYFKAAPDKAINTIEFADGSTVDIQEQVFKFTGKGRISGTVYNDAITGSKKNDTYTLTQGGVDKVVDAKGNDTYKVDITAQNIVEINDKAGKDTLALKNTAKADVIFGFDVNSDGTIAGNSLFVMDKAGTGLVEVDNYFKATTIDDEITALANGGKGKIENIKASDGKVAAFNTAFIDSVKSSVAAWFGLEGNAGFTSASDVFERGNETQIQSLVQAYANVYSL